jgi:CYTH domain-containing protein
MSLTTRIFLPSTLPQNALGGKQCLFRSGFPGNSQEELKVVQEGNRFYEVIQSESSKIELKRVRLNRRQFTNLWSQCSQRQIVAHRYLHRLNGHRVYVDQYQGPLKGLTIIRAEFSSEFQAYSEQIPEWFGPEISFDKRFAEQKLFEHMLPLDPSEVNLDAPGMNCVIGSIPFIQKSSGLRFVTVNTRKQNRTIFPKGQPEQAFHAREIARMETLEEAGVDGPVVGHPILVPYKPGSEKNWILYPLEVTSVKRNWKEKEERSRKFMSADSIVANPECADLVPGVSYVQKLLKARSAPAKMSAPI